MRRLRVLLAVAYPFLVFAGLRWWLPSGAADEARWLLWAPVALNLFLLVAFARTLRRGPPLVETLARLQHPDLSPAQQRHCRTVTGVWCVFFAANAAVCAGLALWAELWLWTLYTGALAYGLMGLLFAAEFCVRSWRFRNYQGTLAEPLFRRLFPEGPPT